MRYALLALAFALTGCAASGSMSEEAAPHAASALDSIDGMRTYLEASGVEVRSARRLPQSPRPGVVRSASYRFENGGACTVLSYASPASAKANAPESVRREKREYSRGSFAGYGGSSALDYVEVPTTLFGANAALCQNEPGEVKRALRALATFAEATPGPAPATTP